VKSDPALKAIKDALKWLTARRKDVYEQREGLRYHLMAGWARADAFEIHRLQEWQTRIEHFDKLIAQQNKKLREYNRAIERSHHEDKTNNEEVLIEALPRPDVLNVKIVESLPKYSDHALSQQIDRRGEVLEAWNYWCLNTRNRRPSRRYEGFSGGFRP